MRWYWKIILFLFPNILIAGKPPVYTGCTPVVTIAESRNNVCADTAVTFHADVLNKGTNSVYKWKKNGIDVGTNNADYTGTDLHDGDIITCEYSCKTTCGGDATVGSNSITMHVINDILPVITVANEDPLICEGELTLFTTTAFYGNAIPSYQWKINNEQIADTTPFYTTDTLTNGSKVECVLTISTPGCPGTRSSTSWMTIYVYPMIHPAIKITPDKTDICRGEAVTFTATANGGAYPSFAWEINGIPTGDTSASLITSSLKDGDSVSCTVTIDQDSRCHTTTSASSNKVGIHVKDYVDPTISIAAPLLEACAGTPLTFTATATNTGDYTLYHWYVNDKSNDINTPTFITNNLANGDKVSCILTTNIPGCSFSADVPSNYKTVTIHDTPIITFLPPDTSLFSGESAVLKASVTGGIASFMWKPDSLLLMPQALTTATVPLGENTVFNLSIVDANGCKASSNVTVKVLYKMHMPSAFTPNKDGRNDIFRVPPGSSVTLQQFFVYDRWGHIIFQTSDIAKGWDGSYQGRDLPAGTYIYLIEGTLYNKKVLEKGTITLVR